MKRKLSILLAVGLIAGSLALPSYAATAETVQEVQTIQTQYGEIQVETVLTVRDTALQNEECGKDVDLPVCGKCDCQSDAGGDFWL